MGGAITGDGGRKRKGIGTRSNVGSSPTFQPWLIDVMFTVGPDSLGIGKDNASGTSVL